MSVSVFPLNAIVCPKGRIALRIFEPRYLDMVRNCLKHKENFIITLFMENAKSEHSFYRVGTEVCIVDFGEMTQNGVLNIVVEGLEQVQLSNLTQQNDGLWVADIQKSTAEQYLHMPDEFDDLCLVLKALIKHPYVKELDMDIDFDDARQVGWRLTELLPLGNEQKQYLYELGSSEQRLSKIADQLSSLVEQ